MRVVIEIHYKDDGHELDEDALARGVAAALVEADQGPMRDIRPKVAVRSVERGEYPESG